MSVKRNWLCCGIVLYFLCVSQIRLEESNLQRLKLSQRIITTRQGKYRGVIVEFPARSSLRDLDAYNGIHYGSFADDNHRFAYPRPLSVPWDIIDTLHPGPSCPQGPKKSEGKVDFRENGDRKRYALNNETIHEDCLYLNVFAPVQGKYTYII